MVRSIECILLKNCTVNLTGIFKGKKVKRRKHELEHWVGNTWIGLPLLAGSPSVRIVLLEEVTRSARGDQSKEIKILRIHKVAT